MINRARNFLATACVWMCLFVASALGDDSVKLVVVFYPEANDGSPGTALADRGIRVALQNSFRGKVEIHSEYLDVSRFPDSSYQGDLANFLKRKYSGRRIDLVIAGLASALDYTMKYRDEIFSGAPIVMCAVDQKEVAKRKLPPDVVGVPIQMELAASLETALEVLPDTRRVYVIVGNAKFDAYWEAEARTQFHGHAKRVDVVYWVGLPMPDLLQRVASLPEHSLIYYLHIFEDGDGKVFMPAEALEVIAAKANAPIFSHVDSYIGRGAVGGRVFGFESAGKNAGLLASQILAGENPAAIGIRPPGENAHVFDWRQLGRFGIRESRLPAGSEVRFKQPRLWDAYKWQLSGVIAVCLLQGFMITGLIVQQARRARAERQRREAEQELRNSQATLRELAGKLLTAEETERRKIARELHDDLGQGLALLSVELDLLKQKPAAEAGQLAAQIARLAERVNQLSTSIHELSHQLHPMKLEQLGLVAALRALCKEVGESHGLEIHFIHDEIPRSTPPEIAICLYRVAQESLQNVVKHSRARHVRVELHLLEGSIGLQIHDDGLGFDPATTMEHEGLGLASMRERLRLVNGQIRVEPGTPAGTQIAANVPLVEGTAPMPQLS